MASKLRSRSGPSSPKAAVRDDFPPVFGQGKNLALTWDLGAFERHYEFLHELGKSGNLGNFT